MFRLDDNFLTELGLGSLPPAEKNKMLAHIYETLEMRVGVKLAEQMTDAQLDEFEGFIDRNDESGALQWLEGNFPNYKQVVADELEKLKAEIKQVAPQIVASALQQTQGASTTPVSADLPQSQGGYTPVSQPGYATPPQQPVYQQTVPSPAQNTYASMPSNQHQTYGQPPVAPISSTQPPQQPTYYPQQPPVPSSYPSTQQQPPATPPQPPMPPVDPTQAQPPQSV